MWQEHDIVGEQCKLSAAELQRFQESADVPHLFAENAPAGDRNGVMAGLVPRPHHFARGFA